jgi:hypothetical protein
MVINKEYSLLKDESLTNYLIKMNELNNYDINNYKHISDRQLNEMKKEENICNEDIKFNDLITKLNKDARLRAFYVYNHANLEVDKFIQEIKKEDYQPSKDILIALSLALHFNSMDLIDLLNIYHFKLDYNNNRDMIILYCFENNIYNINQVNRLLFINDHAQLVNNK